MNLLRGVALLSLALCAATVHAQPDPLKFGQLEAKYLTAAPFVADSAAPAVVLCDYGQARIGANLNERQRVRFTRTTRIKILSKAGLEWANVEVLLRHESPGYAEQLLNLRGFTHNLVNGQPVREPLATAGIFTDKVSAQYTLKKFALPNVRVGSVVEFSYTIESDYLLNFRSWRFQERIPVRWSEFRAEMPYQFNYKMFGQYTRPLAVDEHSSPQDLLPHFRWAMRDVPPLLEEPFMTTPDDYANELTFELANYYDRDITRSWAQIDRDLLLDPDMGQQLDQTGFLKADLANLPPVTATNGPERLAAVRELVLKAVRCTGQPGYYASGSLRKIYQEAHRGTVADANLLLVAALRGAGFAANPVLLSTRHHGRVRASLPQLSQFNYVAAHVALPDGQSLVLDATDPLLPYDMLPVRCLNQQGRLLRPKPDTSRWLPIAPRHRYTHLRQVQLRLTADNHLSGQLHDEYAGYAGAAERSEMQQAGDKKYAAALASQYPGWEVGPPTIANRDSVQRPLKVDYAFRQPLTGDAGASLIYLSPLRDFGLAVNPFKAETRVSPVDFGYAQDETLVVSLTLPAGYEVAELPAAKDLALPGNGGRYGCSATATATTVQLSSHLTLRKPVYPAAEYAALRELYRLLLAKQAEKLVLKKKAG